MSKSKPNPPKPIKPLTPQEQAAAYRKAERTGYGAKHGNTKRKYQYDHTSDRQRKV